MDWPPDGLEFNTQNYPKYHQVNEYLPNYERDKIRICRCWQSKKFPFCDDTHRQLVEAGDEVGPLVVLYRRRAKPGSAEQFVGGGGTFGAMASSATVLGGSSPSTTLPPAARLRRALRIPPGWTLRWVARRQATLFLMSDAAVCCCVGLGLGVGCGFARWVLPRLRNAGEREKGGSRSSTGAHHAVPAPSRRGDESDASSCVGDNTGTQSALAQSGGNTNAVASDGPLPLEATPQTAQCTETTNTTGQQNHAAIAISSRMPRLRRVVGAALRGTGQETANNTTPCTAGSVSSGSSSRMGSSAAGASSSCFVARFPEVAAFVQCSIAAEHNGDQETLSGDPDDGHFDETDAPELPDGQSTSAETESEDEGAPEARRPAQGEKKFQNK